jgi:putative ABC transport system permease protein
VRQLQRQHTRTALTVGVLFIGVIMTIGFGNSLVNNLRDIDTWYRETISSDVLVRGGIPDTGTLASSAMSKDHGRHIAALPGVAHVGRINFVPAVAEGRPIIVLARDFPDGRSLSLALVEGTEEELRAGLRRGEAVLATGLAQRTGLGVGDAITLRTRQGEKRLRVAGVVKEYSVGGMALYLDWDAADELLALKGVHAFEVFARPGEAGRVEEALRPFAAKHGLMVHSNAELREDIDDAVAAVEGFMWVLIGLVFVIASMGIVNTLTMNVQEQTRELGVLRAVGMRRREVRKLVVAQALAMGVLSVLPGIVGGLIVAWIMYAATYPLVGHQVPFAMHFGFIAGCGAVALAVAVAASFLPAHRAARLPVIHALHYE